MIAIYRGPTTLDVDLPTRVITLVPWKAVPITSDEVLVLSSVPGVAIHEDLPPVRPPKPTLEGEEAAPVAPPEIVAAKNKKTRRVAEKESPDGE